MVAYNRCLFQVNKLVKTLGQELRRKSLYNCIYSHVRLLLRQHSNKENYQTTTASILLVIFALFFNVLSPVPRPGLLNLLRGAGNFGKIWSACRQHEIQYTQRRMNQYMHNYMYNVTVYTSSAINMLIIGIIGTNH